MALLVILLLFGGLVTMGLLWRTRTAALKRLDELAGMPDILAPAARPIIAERFLPHGLVRNFHVLDIEPHGRHLALAVLAIVLPAFAVGAWLGALYGLFAAALLVLAALTVLNMLAARRIAEIGDLMPSFLDRVRQLLSIGNSLPVAFARAVQNAQPRLATFFAPAIRRMSNGASFPESVQQSADDIGLYEMRLFAAAVAVNSRFGGSLTQSLNNLVAYLRKRASIERELRASTSQIRASAWVLGLLPLGVGGMIVVQNHEYADWFLHNPQGRWFLGYCLVSQLMGAFAMRAIVRTRF